MKRILFLALAVALCGGCAQTYRITLNDGTYVTSRGKPKFDQSKGSFIYTDGNGQKSIISQAAVRSVAPDSWTSKDDSKTIQFVQ